MLIDDEQLPERVEILAQQLAGGWGERGVERPNIILTGRQAFTQEPRVFRSYRRLDHIPGALAPNVHDPGGYSTRT